MHTYDIDSSERRYVICVLAFLGLLIAFGTHVATDRIGGDWWWLVEVPTPLGAFGLLYWWFERRGWRNPWVRRIPGIETPLLHGRWSGTLWSSHDGQTRDVALDIRQTWTRIGVQVEGPQSRSSSRTASILIKEVPSPLLIYTYLNEPTPDAVDTMQIHYGTAKYIFDREAQTLTGEYYTGRGRETYGTMALRRS